MDRKKIIILIALAAIIIAAIYGWNEYNRKNNDLKGVDAVYSITAGAFINQFAENDSSYSKQYLGKTVSVSGIVKKIEKDGDGSFTVVLGTPSQMTTVRCLMDAVHQKEAEQLKNQQSVIIKGIFTGYQKDETGLLGSDIIMNRCVIDKQ